MTCNPVFCRDRCQGKGTKLPSPSRGTILVSLSQPSCKAAKSAKDQPLLFLLRPPSRSVTIPHIMISATRKWVRRNRTNFAIGFGVIGVTYLAGQYVVSKISETRKRMSSDRIAREK